MLIFESNFITFKQGRSQRGRGAGPPIEILFLVFGLKFSRGMLNIHFFINKFSKIAKRWGLTAPSAL